jgi:hypothetical protein
LKPKQIHFHREGAKGAKEFKIANRIFAPLASLRWKIFLLTLRGIGGELALWTWNEMGVAENPVGGIIARIGRTDGTLFGGLASEQ